MKWIIKTHAAGRTPEYVRRQSMTDARGAIDFTEAASPKPNPVAPSPPAR